MAEFRVKKGRLISAEMTVPGDKSISHRAVMLAAMAKGTTEIRGFLPSEDCQSTVDAMRALGVEITAVEAEESETENTRLRVAGNAMHFTAPKAPIDCGNSGTLMRLISGILSAQPFATSLSGDESLNKRPMKRIVTPLAQMGAHIITEGDGGTPPMHFHAQTGKLTPIRYELPVASAQVKSAVLLAGLFADGKTTVVEPTPTRNHTETMFKHFGVKTSREGNDISIYGGQVPEARDFLIPGDISSSAFWLVAAAAQPDALLTVENVGLNNTRSGILKVLIRMGAQVTDVVAEGGQGEPYGKIVVKGTKLKGTVIEGAEIPNVIDELPILAVAGALAEGKTIIRDAEDLRAKETDRINAVATNLQAMGVKVSEFHDGMEIEGGCELKGARLRSRGDHRIAMAFAIAGLFAEGETIIEDVECVDTSYPGFETELKRFMSKHISYDVQTRTVSQLPPKGEES